MTFGSGLLIRHTGSLALQGEVPLMVSLSNYERERSPPSFDKLRTSGSLPFEHTGS